MRKRTTNWVVAGMLALLVFLFNMAVPFGFNGWIISISVGIAFYYAIHHMLSTLDKPP